MRLQSGQMDSGGLRHTRSHLRSGDFGAVLFQLTNKLKYAIDLTLPIVNMESIWLTKKLFLTSVIVKRALEFVRTRVD